MLLRSHHNFTGRDLISGLMGTVATGCDAYLELPHLPAPPYKILPDINLYFGMNGYVRVCADCSPNSVPLLVSLLHCDRGQTTDLSEYCQTLARGNLLPETLVTS